MPTERLQWDEPFFSVSGPPGSSNDLDIAIYSDSFTATLEISGTVSNVGGDPLELIGFFNPGPETSFNIVIEKKPGGPDPGLMKYVIFDSSNTVMIREYDTASGTIVGHANAEGAEAVGAAAYYNTPEFGVSPARLNPYSSWGGTPIFFTTDETVSRWGQENGDKSRG